MREQLHPPVKARVTTARRSCTLSQLSWAEGGARFMARPQRHVQQVPGHPEYGLCRGWNHQWPGGPSKADLTTHPTLGLVIEASQHCSQCGSERVRYLDPATGERLAGKMVYNEGYVRVGEGRMPTEEQDALRLDGLRYWTPNVVRRLKRTKLKRVK